MAFVFPGRLGAPEVLGPANTCGLGFRVFAEGSLFLPALSTCSVPTPVQIPQLEVQTDLGFRSGCSIYYLCNLG